MWFSFALVLFTWAYLIHETCPNLVVPRKYATDDTFRPAGLALGSNTSSQVRKFQKFQLSPSVPVATLDYGSEVAGYPIFTAESVRGKVQIEVKYTEEFRGLNSNYSDGPFTFSIGLSNTYRVETFEITKPGVLEAYLLQGGQRWQSIRLLTNGTVTFSSVGFKASVPVTHVDELPGTFQSSDINLNDIWKLGAKAALLACVEKGTQRAMWDVDEKGAFVRGMRSGVSDQGAFFQDYTLEFDAKIERAGFGWTVAQQLASPARGIQLNLVGDLPPECNFVNTNKSLTPPNSILLGYGFSLLNATTLTSYHLATFTIPFSVKEKTWYKVRTSLSGDQYLSVSVDERQIFNVSLQEYYVGDSSILTNGSFGFGGLPDQAGLFKDVLVYDTANKAILYQNPLTDAAKVVAEYGVHENYDSVCLDGPKRDRLVWLGDFIHTVQIIGTSTSRYDLAQGTLDLFLKWQIPSGLLPYDPYMGYHPSTALAAFARGGIGAVAGREVWSLILADYQILGLLSMAYYVRLSNDLDFARRTWAQWQLQTTWILDQIDPTTGLLSLIGAFLGPASGGSAVNCAFVQTLNMVADVATAVNDTDSASRYRTAATTLSAAINKSLWNSKLGVYSLSLTSPSDYSVSSIGFCITSGTSNATQAAEFISALPNVRVGPGYRDSTQDNVSDPSIKISLNTNGFLLAALLSQRSASTAEISRDLLHSLWIPMLNNRETSTGTSWEYINLQGNPGLDLYTSLSHPWGGAPTYLLTEYVAGIRAARGVEGFGYQSWVFDPYAGLAMGLKKAETSVVTAFGGSLKVKWQVLHGNVMDVKIKAPWRTRGIVVVGDFKKALSGKSEYHLKTRM